MILFASSIKENITYGRPNASLQEINDAAELAHATEFIQSFPNKLETLAGERGMSLSGGQKQRFIFFYLYRVSFLK